MSWFKKRKLSNSDQEIEQGKKQNITSSKALKKFRNTDRTYYELQHAYGTSIINSMSEKGQIIDAIKSFVPFKKYNEELPYQIDLARMLHSKFPDVKI